MKRWNVIFIKPSSRLLLLPEETSAQTIPSSNGLHDRNYITDDDFLRDLRDYTSVLEPLLSAHRWPICLKGSATSPGGVYGSAELQGHRKRRLCPGGCRRRTDRKRALSNRWRGRCHPQQAPWQHHWLGHPRSSNGGIRV